MASTSSTATCPDCMCMCVYVCVAISMFHWWCVCSHITFIVCVTLMAGLALSSSGSQRLHGQGYSSMLPWLPEVMHSTSFCHSTLGCCQERNVGGRCVRMYVWVCAICEVDASGVCISMYMCSGDISYLHICSHIVYLGSVLFWLW